MLAILVNQWLPKSQLLGHETRVKVPDERYSSDGRATTTMKNRKSGSKEGGKTLARVRILIKQAVPERVEEWKWRGVPVWSHAGLICTGEAYKSIHLAGAGSSRSPPSRPLTLVFFGGASLTPGPRALATKPQRALDVGETDKLYDA